MTFWVAGLGCRQGCPLEALRPLLEQVLARAEIDRSDLTEVATVEARRREPALQQLAAELGLDVRAWPARALRKYEDRLTVRSERAFSEVGCYGVAESAALASATVRGQPGILIVGRMSNGQATAALARYPMQPPAVRASGGHGTT